MITKLHDKLILLTCVYNNATNMSVESSAKAYLNLIEKELRKNRTPSFRIGGIRLYSYCENDAYPDIEYRNNGFDELETRLNADFVYHAVQILEALFRKSS